MPFRKTYDDGSVLRHKNVRVKKEYSNMVTMKPIMAQEILDIFNRGRFEGELEGYIISDGQKSLGYCLYMPVENMVRVLAAEAEDASLLDGVIRASLSSAMEDGAVSFSIADTTPSLSEWRRLWCRSLDDKAFGFDTIFGPCKGE